MRLNQIPSVCFWRIFNCLVTVRLYVVSMNIASTSNLAKYAKKELKLVRSSDPVLHSEAAPVDVNDPHLYDVFEKMEDKMYAKSGAGLAAPQVGIPYRMMIVDAGDGPVHLANPRITESSGWLPSVEGCLSLTGTISFTGRSSRVTVEAHDEFGEPFKMKCRGFKAIAMQHELDHLDGTLMTDRKGAHLTPLRMLGGAAGLVAGAFLNGTTGAAIGGALGVAATYGLEKALKGSPQSSSQPS